MVFIFQASGHVGFSLCNIVIFSLSPGVPCVDACYFVNVVCCVDWLIEVEGLLTCYAQ